MTNTLALISGGGTGLGKSIAKRYLQSQITVIITGRRTEFLNQTKAELKQYGSIIAYPCDISKVTEVEKLTNYIREEFGYLNILVNNAGVLGSLVRIEDYPTDLWDQVIRTNLNGAFYLSKYCIPLLRAGKNSVIFNISSAAGKQGKKHWGPYCASKFALEGFSEVLGEELRADSIRVYSVNPGAMRTSMRAQAYPDEDPKSITDPDKVAELFIELLSNHEHCEDTQTNHTKR